MMNKMIKSRQLCLDLASNVVLSQVEAKILKQNHKFFSCASGINVLNAPQILALLTDENFI